jgi:serine carboxypeptidase-like clade 2
MVQIGNAAIDDETDNQGMYDFFGTHALISYDNLRKIRRYCDFSRAHESAECRHSLLKTDADVWNAIDVYNIHGPLCLDGNLTSRPRKTSVSKNKLFSTKRRKKMHE